jgi:hypothetical protein
MFTYCIEELQFRAKEHPNSPNGAIRVYNGDVYKSDTAVSEETKLALQKAVRVLEDIPAAQKDWRPGSDGKILDLVHPSLFPLIYGISKILPIGAPMTTLEDCVKRCGEGEVLPDPKTKEPNLGVDEEDLWSTKFQWLPCEVDISGDKPKILTYINNLHHLELSSAYDLTSLTPYSSLLAFLDSRGAVPPGVDVKLVIRGVPIVPPCNDAFSGSSIACSSSSPSPPSTTTSKTHLDALKLVHSILSRTFSKIDDTLCSLLSINTKVQIQMAFDTTVGVETFVQAHRDIVGKYAKEIVDSLMSSSVFSDSWTKTNNTKTKKNSGTEGLVLLQLHEDLYVQFDPPEDEEEDDEETESAKARETRRLQDLTRRFKSLYLPNLSSKHQEVELAVELVDVYDLDEDMDQRTVEEEEVDSTESSCTRAFSIYRSVDL